MGNQFQIQGEYVRGYRDIELFTEDQEIIDFLPSIMLNSRSSCAILHSWEKYLKERLVPYVIYRIGYKATMYKFDESVSDPNFRGRIHK